MTQPIFDRDEQLEQIRSGLLQGEELFAALDNGPGWAVLRLATAQQVLDPELISQVYGVQVHRIDHAGQPRLLFDPLDSTAADHSRR